MIALDHYLPTGTGIEFLERLAQRADVPPVVYVTGSSELNLGVAAMRAGASDFVAKTVGDDFVTLLEAALAQAVARARLTGEKEAAETEVRRARDRAELLLAEVNHRVANSLAIVASMIRIQARGTPDVSSRDLLNQIHDRVHAVALVHRRLYASDQVNSVDLADFLSTLVDQLGAMMRDTGHRGLIRQEVAPIAFPTDKSVSLGIVTAELVTNAFKYAYPTEPGEIRVRLERSGQDHAVLTVADDGIGRTEGAAPRGTGLGSRLVAAMVGSLDATLDYLDGAPGTIARITFPI